MPRKSAAALELAHSAVTRLPERPKPPAAFRRGSAEWKAWEDIVGSQAADWFTSGDMPLLEAYCRAFVQYRRVSEQIETANGGLGAEFTVHGAQGGLMPNPVYAVQDRLSRQMATLAVKLRLSQSSRVSRAAGGKAPAAGAAKEPQKPWQRNAS